MNIIILFTILTIVNVIFSTIKSIVTIKSSPFIASVVSALYYGYYNIVLIYTVADFPLWQKVVITSVCNLVGVFIVKYGEIKSRKDKLWKIEATIPTKYTETVDYNLDNLFVPHFYVKLSDKHTLFTFYCETQAETLKVKEIIDKYNARYFVSENHAIL